MAVLLAALLLCLSLAPPCNPALPARNPQPTPSICSRQPSPPTLPPVQQPAAATAVATVGQSSHLLSLDGAEARAEVPRGSVRDCIDGRAASQRRTGQAESLLPTPANTSSSPAGRCATGRRQQQKQQKQQHGGGAIGAPALLLPLPPPPPHPRHSQLQQAKCLAEARGRQSRRLSPAAPPCMDGWAVQGVPPGASLNQTLTASLAQLLTGPTTHDPAALLAPGSGANYGDGSGCFPSAATVQVQGRGAVPMHQLALGDWVLALDRGSGGALVYRPVYLFGHRNSSASGQYVNIEVELGGAAAGGDGGGGGSGGSSGGSSGGGGSQSEPAAPGAAGAAGGGGGRTAVLRLTPRHFLPLCRHGSAAGCGHPQLPAALRQLPALLRRVPPLLLRLLQLLEQLSAAIGQLPEQLYRLPGQLKRQLVAVMWRLPGLVARQAVAAVRRLPGLLQKLAWVLRQLPERTRKLPGQLRELQAWLWKLPQRMRKLPERFRKLPAWLTARPRGPRGSAAAAVPTSGGGAWQYSYAEDVLPGMLVFVASDGDTSLLRPAVVRQVWTSQEAGLFNPFVEGGTILVDGVLASDQSDWLLDDWAPAACRRFLPLMYGAVLYPARLLYRALGPAAMQRLDSALGLTHYGHLYGSQLLLLLLLLLVVLPAGLLVLALAARAARRLLRRRLLRQPRGTAATAAAAAPLHRRGSPAAAAAAGPGGAATPGAVSPVKSRRRFRLMSLSQRTAAPAVTADATWHSASNGGFPSASSYSLDIV